MLYTVDATKKISGVVAFRLIAPPVGSTAEPQPKSNKG